MSRPWGFNIIKNLRRTHRVWKHERYTPNIYKGIDSHGNKYYQKEGSDDGTIKRKRWAEPPDGSNMYLPRVPVQWDMWLRGRHESPPSEEYEQIIEARVERGKQMSAKEARELQDSEELRLPQDPNKTVPFPKYDEFKHKPDDQDKYKS